MVGTALNSASLPMLCCINTSAVGNLFAMTPANTPAGSFHKGPTFTKSDNPELAEFFPANGDPLDMFKFVKFPAVFPIP